MKSTIYRELSYKYSNFRKKAFFEKISNYKYNYAIIGTGLHNLTNLTPCLKYLNVPITTVFSQQRSHAESLARQFANCKSTTDLKDIANDGSIKAVFISIRPDLQADVTRKMLDAGKHVFVEKPVGHSLKALQEIYSSQSGLLCHVNLQRRYSAVSTIIRRNIKDAETYNYQFSTGSYLEGDEIFELFIHPVDFVLFLFGPAQVEHISVQRINTNLHCNVILQHNKVKGNLELSTNFTWQNARDQIIINTASKILHASYPHMLEATLKPLQPFNIPVEKILNRPLKRLIYLDGDNFIPTAELTSHYLNGFLPSVKQFVNLVENDKSSELSTLQSLLPTYRVLDAIAAKK